jgi:hypothetical protein
MKLYPLSTLIPLNKKENTEFWSFKNNDVKPGNKEYKIEKVETFILQI